MGVGTEKVTQGKTQSGERMSISQCFVLQSQRRPPPAAPVNLDKVSVRLRVGIGECFYQLS